MDVDPDILKRVMQIRLFGEEKPDMNFAETVKAAERGDGDGHALTKQELHRRIRLTKELLGVPQDC